MYRFIKRIWIIAAVVILAACSSSKDPRNAPAELVEFKQTMAIKPVWSVEVGASGDYVFSPGSAENSIFAAAANGTIVRIDRDSGREIWKVKTPSPLTAGVGADWFTVAVVGNKGTLFAYDLDGKLRWQAQLSSEVLAPPVVGGGVVVVHSVNNHIAGYDSVSGKRLWDVERTLPPLILRSAAGMVIAGNSVLVGLPGGKLLAISLTNGNVIWEAAVSEPRGATELERVADVSGVPIIVGSDVCASAYQGRVSCFDIQTGVMRWSKKLSSDTGIAADERFVFVVDDKDMVNAFSRRTGASEWKNSQLVNRRLSSPVSYGQAVAVADLKGYIHFLSREDGSFLARTATDGSAVVATPLVVGAIVVFQTKAGRVTALAIN